MKKPVEWSTFLIGCASVNYWYCYRRGIGQTEHMGIHTALDLESTTSSRRKLER
ncbi:Uncharacterised protein [Mycobacterium tuberculosis]|nr:Uncharacterised protein [Mycobacterium tuberculosis]